MDVVGVMAAYLPVVSVCTAQSRDYFSLVAITKGLLWLKGSVYSMYSMSVIKRPTG